MERKENHVTDYENIRNATNPYFHYPLYLQISFRGKTIWALNEKHWQYLIDYYETYKTMCSQADKLPTYMKYAKNRRSIVKIVKKLHDEKLSS